MLRSPAMDALRAKYGKYLPHQRSNVDQVPLPFVNDMETTGCCSRRPEGSWEGGRGVRSGLDTFGSAWRAWHRFLWDLGKFMARFFNVSVF